MVQAQKEKGRPPTAPDVALAQFGPLS